MKKEYLLISSMMISLAACDFMTPKSIEHHICQDIARNRIKHPKSYDLQSETEVKTAAGQTEVNIFFMAWNDYKVPIPYNISCIFQSNSEIDSATPELVAIKWNNSPIRQHELDDIKDSLKRP